MRMQFELCQSEAEFIFRLEPGKLFERRQKHERLFMLFGLDQPRALIGELLLNVVRARVLEHVQKRSLNPVFGFNRRLQSLPQRVQSVLPPLSLVRG